MATEYGEPLTERELEITELVAEGLTNREVAERLYLSHNTVKVHLRNIFTKTGVASRTELSMLAVQEGWIVVPGAPEESDGTSVTDGTQDTPETGPSQPTLPPWPWQRWIALTWGLGLVLMVSLLPRRHPAPVTTTGPGDVFSATGTVPQVMGAAAEEGWQELAPLPVRRAGMGVAAKDSEIYVIGGMTDGGPSGRVDIYDMASDTWREGRARPVALAHVGAVILDGDIWVPGGCTSDQNLTPSTAVHRYDPDQDTWEEAAPLPTPLCAYALVTDGERILLFGGWDGHAYRALTYAYNPEQDTWEELTPPTQARGFGAAAMLADRVFYIGGYDGEREWATCEVYFPETDTWTTCQPMLQPRGGLGLAAIGGRIHAIGGGWQTPLGFNERYTPATDEWSVVETPIASEWRNLGVVPWETSLYAMGGWSGTDFLNRTYAVEVMPWRVFIPGTFRTP